MTNTVRWVLFKSAVIASNTLLHAMAMQVLRLSRNRAHWNKASLEATIRFVIP